MRRRSLVLVYGALLALASCGKDVEDPTFNSDSAGGPAGTAASSSSSSDGGNEDTDGGDDNSEADQGQDSDADSSPPATDDGTNPTTGPVGDSGGDDMGDGGGGCGNGMVSPGEQCDGADLQGFDCNSLGLNGGTLSCDPVTCTFDTSMCGSSSGGSSG